METSDQIFTEFVDLLTINEQQIAEDVPLIESDEPEVQEAMNAFQLSKAELYQELTRRGIAYKGFASDDAETLQKEFNKEHEQHLQEDKLKRENARKAAAEQASQRRRRMLMERQLKEEHNEMSANPRAEFWLSMVRNNSTPPSMRLEINSIGARVLAKSMWNNTSLVVLNLSQNELNEMAGAYLGRMLTHNNTVQSLDLSENRIGPKALSVISKALMVNTTLKHLSLESNLLTNRGEDISGITAFSAMLRVNHTLTSVNLWRCWIGNEAGGDLAAGIQQNSSLLFVELGFNDIGLIHENSVVYRLESNVKGFEEQNVVERELRANKRKNDAKIFQAQEQRRKELELTEWIEEQKLVRADQRRTQLEDDFKRFRTDMERKRTEDLERIEKIKRDKEEAENKKKKKKKKK